ncbi:MAG TPA: ATP-binding protein [bacterium]|nr:ATP-binding protein [bacterium]
MIARLLGEKILAWSKQYPVVTVTGPRQSGKTTLCKALFPLKPYVSLEDLSIRQMAIADPRGFLARYPNGAVLDEIQRAPDLCSSIQTIVDDRNEAGMFILTGSQQFELMGGVSQSLAGRTAIARLLPLSYRELHDAGTIGSDNSLDSILQTGFYPRIHAMHLDPSEAMSFYVSTYIERDVRQLLNIKDLSKFETFVRLLAGRSGQLLNASSVAADCGISHATAASWIGVLEQSAIIYLLRPYFINIGKRLLKSPKLYFLDSGLLCYLLGIHSAAHLQAHPLRGPIFESFVVAELLKSRFNAGLSDIFSFYRDSKGLEVDILAIDAGTTLLCEIKSSATFHADFMSSIDRLADFLPRPCAKALVLGNTDDPYRYKECMIHGYPHIYRMLDSRV